MNETESADDKFRYPEYRRGGRKKQKIYPSPFNVTLNSLKPNQTTNELWIVRKSATFIG